MNKRTVTMLTLLALPTLGFAPAASASCNNYGIQVIIGSNSECTANYQYCHQGAGAGAGAGAGGPGQNSAEASAGTSNTCSQENDGGSCADSSQSQEGIGWNETIQPVLSQAIPEPVSEPAPAFSFRSIPPPCV